MVVNKDGDFKGLISSWDITVECARDDRAWPWNRQEDGKFHRAGGDAKKTSATGPAASTTAELGTSPTTPVDETHFSKNNEQRQSHLGDSFRDYIDNLGLVDM